MPRSPSPRRPDEGDAVIMHPGIVCIMVRLLPRLRHEDHPQVPAHAHLSCVPWLVFQFPLAQGSPSFGPFQGPSTDLCHLPEAIQGESLLLVQ